MKYILAVAIGIVVGFGVALLFTHNSLQSTSVVATSSSGVIDLTVAHEYDNTSTYTVDASYPQFGIPNVDSVIKGKVEQAINEFKQIPGNPSDSATPQNDFTGSFDSVYVSPSIISTELTLSQYTGGAHPSTVAVGVNIDRSTGKEIPLDGALALIGKSLQQVASSSDTTLKSDYGENYSFPEGAAPTADNYSTFVISTSTVTFIFQQYQVVPYAAGMPEVSFARVR